MTKRYASKFGPTLQNTLDAIRECEPFNAGNLTGAWIDLDYVVKSYDAVIARYVGHRWEVNNTKYSATTSAHQSVVRRALA